MVWSMVCVYLSLPLWVWRPCCVSCRIDCCCTCVIAVSKFRVIHYRAPVDINIYYYGNEVYHNIIYYNMCWFDCRVPVRCWALGTAVFITTLIYLYTSLAWVVRVENSHGHHKQIDGHNIIRTYMAILHTHTLYIFILLYLGVQTLPIQRMYTCVSKYIYYVMSQLVTYLDIILYWKED